MDDKHIEFLEAEASILRANNMDTKWATIEERAAKTLAAATRLRELVERNRTLAARLAADHRFEQSPCPICDYNGEGYFQPEKHPCAAMYHAAQSRRLHVTTQSNINKAATDARNALEKP